MTLVVITVILVTRFMTPVAALMIPVGQDKMVKMILLFIEELQFIIWLDERYDLFDPKYKAWQYFIILIS